MTHPADDLRLANERGAELRRMAAEHRLAAQIRSDRRSGQHRRTEAAPSWRRPKLVAGVAASALFAVVVSLGTFSDRADASTAGTSDQSSAIWS